MITAPGGAVAIFLQRRTYAPHRSHQRPGNPGLPGPAHRFGRSPAGQRPVYPGHGALGGVHRRERGPGAAGRRLSLPGQRGAAGGQKRRGDHPAGPERPRPPGAGADRPDHVPAGRHPHQEQTGGQRHPGRLHGGGPGRGRGLVACPCTVTWGAPGPRLCPCPC